MDIPDVRQTGVCFVEAGIFLPVIGDGLVIIPASIKMPHHGFKAVTVAFECQRHFPFVVQSHYHQKFLVRGGGCGLGIEPEAGGAAIV